MTRDADVDYSGTVVQSTTGWDNGRTRKAKLNEELNELSAEDLRSSPVRLSALACRFRPRLPSRMSDWLGPIGNLIRHHPQFSDFFGDTNTAKVLVKMVGS